MDEDCLLPGAPLWLPGFLHPSNISIWHLQNISADILTNGFLKDLHVSPEVYQDLFQHIVVFTNKSIGRQTVSKERSCDCSTRNTVSVQTTRFLFCLYGKWHHTNWQGSFLQAEKGTLKVTDYTDNKATAICLVRSIVSLQNEDSEREGRDKVLLPADTNTSSKSPSTRTMHQDLKDSHRKVSLALKSTLGRWIPHKLRHGGRGKRACQDYCKLKSQLCKKSNCKQIWMEDPNCSTTNESP